MAYIHLLVVIPGLWGLPSHVAELARTIQETFVTKSPEGVEIQVLLAETNCEEATVDGIDWGGERVTREVC